MGGLWPPWPRLLRPSALCMWISSFTFEWAKGNTIQKLCNILNFSKTYQLQQLNNLSIKMVCQMVCQTAISREGRANPIFFQGGRLPTLPTPCRRPCLRLGSIPKVQPSKHLKLTLTEMAHVNHMWSSKNTCDFSHVKHMCKVEVFHMWNFTCDFSHVFHMWNFTWDFSHVKFHMWNFTYEISHVKFHMWIVKCDISHLRSLI